MIRVAALTSGRTVPSSRLRVRQHIGPLREQGIEVREFAPAVEKYAPVPGWMATLSHKPYVPSFLIEQAWRGVKRAVRLPGILGSWRSRITWLERTLLPGYSTAERLLKGPLVFDVDDAIWLHPPHGRKAAAAIAARADVVIAGNRYLADWFSAHARQVRVVPTAIDTDRFRPREAGTPHGDEPFVIGWTGTSGNLGYLEAVEPSLNRFLFDHEDAEMLVLCDRPPSFKGMAGRRLRYVPWTEIDEVRELQKVDVGLMPVPDDEWTRGKCGFKILQYLACAIPAIASPVGVNAEILGMGKVGLAAAGANDWYGALTFFHADRVRARAYGTAGRGVVEQHFSRKVVSRLLTDIFRGLA